MNSKDRFVFGHILDFCSRIEKMRERFGNTLAAFCDDIAYQDAVCMCLLQIGELAGKLSDEAQKATCSIPWREVRAFRNICAHNYGAVIFEDVWNTVVEDIPALEAEIKRVLKAE